MMNPVRRIDGAGANAVDGNVVWSPAKSIWNSTMLLGAITAPLAFSWGAFAVFVASTYLTLLLGHSVGMHRRLIHRSYECHKWLERALIYIGVVVGVAGPFGVLRIHDHRDWAQRQRHCHDFFAHRRHALVDIFWQLHCRFRFVKPPRFAIEPEFSNDRFYRFLERTWMAQQVPVAIAMYAMGGLGWVAWGVCARVSASAIGHWSITYFCHRPGPGVWRVDGAVVQASNLPGFGWLTFGECWHNNHHAFPESACIGIERGQSDPGWYVLRILQQAGWVWDLGRPRPHAQREDLVYVA